MPQIVLFSKLKEQKERNEANYAIHSVPRVVVLISACVCDCACAYEGHALGHVGIHASPSRFLKIMPYFFFNLYR